MAGELVTGPGLIQWGNLLLGRSRAGGVATTPYRWRTLTGWEDTPGLDTGTVLRAQDHGGWPGRLLAQTRTITIPDLTIRTVPGALGTAVRTLEAATPFGPDLEQPLVVQLDERGPLLVWARLIRRQLPVSPNWQIGHTTGGALQWEATDPRRYQLAEQSAVTGLPASEAGLDWRETQSQLLTAAQQSGSTPTSGWWAVQGLTVGSSGSQATVTITAASSGTPAMVGWSGTASPSTYGFPVTVGQQVRFIADALPPGGALIVHWVTAAGAYNGESDETSSGLVVGTAPAGTAYARPIMMWTAIPTPAAQPIGQTRLYVPDPGPGLSWGSPTETGLAWGTPGSTGDVTITNSGTAQANPIIEFRGPVVSPSVTLLATGQVLEYGITLALGDVLTVDTWAGTVLLGGQSRIATATNRSSPEGSFVLPPGSSTLSFRAGPGSVDPAASATVRYRSAYW